jgi:ABC-type bacteriocin/lantibiotic exporter with double-glycine peptidase domain
MKSLFNYINNILFLSQNKKNLFLILLIFITSSILEILGIGLLGPFFALLLKAEVPFIFSQFNFFDNKLLLICVIMILIFFLRTIFLIFSIFYTYKFSYKTQQNLRVKLLSNYLSLPYNKFLEKNASKANENIQNLVQIFTFSTLITFIKILGELILIFFLLILLFLTNIKLVFYFLFFIFCLSFFYDYFFKKKIYSLSSASSKASEKIIKITNDIIKGIKEIKIYFKENYFIKKAKEYSNIQYQSSLNIGIISNAARYIIEFFFILLFMLSVIYYIIKNDDLNHFISQLTVFALAGIRLIPSINSLQKLVIDFRYGKYATNILSKELKNKIETKKIIQNKKNFVFKKISFKKVTFKYESNRANFLKNLNLSILSGDRVLISGNSGSGKTTLLNMIIGFLTPVKGSIKINDIDIKKVLKDWQSNIAYIPQDIFLMNSSIYENITLESEKKNIHQKRLLKAINMAKINNLIKDKGLDMVIGDGGIKISGGQRQRLGIARAIYFNKKILILDESTNSLDQKIKKEILEELLNFDQSYTIIIVDHNIDNFNFFNKILKIENHSIFCKISN